MWRDGQFGKNLMRSLMMKEHSRLKETQKDFEELLGCCFQWIVSSGPTIAAGRFRIPFNLSRKNITRKWTAVQVLGVEKLLVRL